MITIAYNDGRTIRLAAQLLFHYFPELNASKPIEHKVRTESCKQIFIFRISIFSTLLRIILKS